MYILVMSLRRTPIYILKAPIYILKAHLENLYRIYIDSRRIVLGEHLYTFSKKTYINSQQSPAQVFHTDNFVHV